ncbi:MAG: Uma2 family endonuclease [Chthoniobacterales bacterium]
MLPTTHQRMTAEEYRQLPEGPPYFQLIRGELFMSPSPRFWHQKIALNIASSIREHLRRNRGLGEVIISPSDVELSGDDVYQPDIYFVSADRLAEVITEQGATGAPDLVVEVLSASTAKLDRGPKGDLYGAAGVKEMWLVDGREKKIEVFRASDGRLAWVETLSAGDTLETQLLPGWKLEVREIFES